MSKLIFGLAGLMLVLCLGLSGCGTSADPGTSSNGTTSFFPNIGG